MAESEIGRKATEEETNDALDAAGEIADKHCQAIYDFVHSVPTLRRVVLGKD